MTRSSPLVAFAASAGLVALTVYLLVVGQSVLVPFVLAVFIAYLISALSHAVSRLSIGGWSPGPKLSMTAAILSFAVVMTALIDQIAGNIDDVAQQAPQYQERLEGLYAQINALLMQYAGREAPLTFVELANELNLQRILGGIVGSLNSIASNAFQILLYVIFLLLEGRNNDRKLKALFSDPAREEAVRGAIQRIGRGIEKYVLIKTAMSLLVAVLSYAALWFMGVDFAGFWALLTFAINFIPYLGSAIAVTLPVIMTLLQFGDIGTMLLVLGLLAAAQVFVGNVVEPRYTGKSLNLSPVVIVMALSTWGAIWGITGMFLSVPITVMLTIACAAIPATRPIAIALSQTGDLGGMAPDETASSKKNESSHDPPT